MTTTDDDSRGAIEQVLATYRDHPMDDGDALLLLPEGGAALEVAGLADHWDDELCASTVAALTGSGARHVVLAVARHGAQLTRQDQAIWDDLRRALPEQHVLDPLVALPGTRASGGHRRAS